MDALAELLADGESGVPVEALNCHASTLKIAEPEPKNLKTMSLVPVITGTSHTMVCHV
jgi:hypothetical protein